MGSLSSEQRIEAVVLQPGELTAQLVGVDLIGLRRIYQAREETAASCAGAVVSGWKGRSVALLVATSDDLEMMSWSRTAAHGELTWSAVTARLRHMDAPDLRDAAEAVVSPIRMLIAMQLS